MCPCSVMTIPYDAIISLSPSLHQVCSSELITDEWISILKQSTTIFAFLDWRNNAFQQFQLLSNLCELANTTISDAVKRFLSSSYITSNVITEIDFNAQLESTLHRFFNSTVVYFGHFVDMVDLLMQVDQPYMGTVADHNAFNADLLPKLIINMTTFEILVEVCFS